MNTSKQINVMVILIFLLLIALGAYTLFDPTREQSARAEQTDLLGQRGATLFAANCRPCHGDVGQGRIGPALNRADLRDPGKLPQLQAFVRDTITCGRVGTLMPTWGQTEGGPLDAEQIRGLVTLITLAPNDAWNNYVKPDSEAANKLATPAPVEDLLKGSITGSQDSVCGQKVANATPVVPATPGVPSTSLKQTTTDNKFSDTSLTVPVSQTVQLALSNQGNALHNWHVIDAKDSTGKDITTGANGTAGGANSSVSFTIAKAGTYHFQCDFHFTEMTGTLFVLEAGGAAPASASAPASAAGTASAVAPVATAATAGTATTAPGTSTAIAGATAPAATPTALASATATRTP